MQRNDEGQIIAKQVEMAIQQAGSVVCHRCSGHMARGAKPVEFEYKAHKVTLEQPGWYCASCEENILTGADMMTTEPAFLEFKQEVDDNDEKT